jgi:hypothetical protein
MEKMFGYYADSFIKLDSELSFVLQLALVPRIKIYDIAPE